ncbi:MAG: rhombotarget lipoprotein [Gammaproteobacteria bacterium]|nr:rhombotarget lipoprotein [Gammaproteobacteria bacterium]
MKKGIGILSIIILLTLLSACAVHQTRTKSSVVDYLYPKTDTIVQPSVPVLKIPVSVGIAFVPEQGVRTNQPGLWPGLGNSGITESQKNELLEKVAENFRKYEFVGSIEVIPSAYLTAEGSFSNLEQIKTMYNIDVIALVSYDQVQFTDEGLLSLTYWTVVGAYVVNGEKNDTSTMLDTVVMDINSRKMLFRAPGTSDIKGSSTLINLSEKLRIDRLSGFAEATDKMIVNLDEQLASFKEKIKAKPEQVKITYSPGYSGSGGGGGGILSMTDISALLLLLLLSSHRKMNFSRNLSRLG